MLISHGCWSGSAREWRKLQTDIAQALGYRFTALTGSEALPGEALVLLLFPAPGEIAYRDCLRLLTRLRTIQYRLTPTSQGQVAQLLSGLEQAISLNQGVVIL